MDNNEKRSVDRATVDSLNTIYARLISAHATLDIIHDNVTENPAADALYGMLFTLDGIAHDLCAVCAVMEGMLV